MDIKYTASLLKKEDQFLDHAKPLALVFMNSGQTTDEAKMH